jgi:hypothetical protein
VLFEDAAGQDDWSASKSYSEEALQDAVSRMFPLLAFTEDHSDIFSPLVQSSNAKKRGSGTWTKRYFVPCLERVLT